MFYTGKRKILHYMKKIKYYIASMRLRTLPLSLSGVILGLMLAAADFHLRWDTVLLTLLTTAFLQILANVSNEYGDYKSGTDSSDRKGPAYSLTGGFLTEKDFKRMILVYVILCAVSGIALIKVSFGTLIDIEPCLMILLGAAAIKAATHYTLGKNPYGYRGLGDLYVFLFFGLVSVTGAYYVASHDIRPLMLLPASAIGFFSVAVLNVNNIRDMETDARTRITIPLRIGERNAKIYQTALIAAGWICMVIYTFLRVLDPWHFLFLITLPLFIIHIVKVWRRSGKALDPALPLLVMSTFAFSILGGLGFLVFLF